MTNASQKLTDLRSKLENFVVNCKPNAVKRAGSFRFKHHHALIRTKLKRSSARIDFNIKVIEV